MNQIYQSRLFQLGSLFICAVFLLANNGNAPDGRTGAPFDGHCNNCHNGSNPGNFNGTVSLSGLPATISPNTVYNLTLTMEVTAGNPVKGGFQMVVVDNNNANCGDLAASNAETGTSFSGTREYIDQRNAKTFGGNPISWDFKWTSPASVAGNTVKVYYIGNFTNNNNNSSGDFPIAASETFGFTGPPPVMASIVSTQHVLCNGGNTGSATVEATGGTTPYTYQWSNGQTGQTATNLAAGNYTVTVTGASGSGTSTAVATITQPSLISLSASANGTLSCINSIVTTTATGSGGMAPYNYAWSNGDTGNQATISVPGTYFVTLTDANGCTKTASVNVGGNTTPPLVLVAPAGSINCSTSQVVLSGAGSSSGPNFQALWATTNGHIVSGATTLTPLVNAAGTYTLTITNTTNGCTASAFTTVSADLDPPVVAATGAVITCTTASVVLGVSFSPACSVVWTGPGGFSSNQMNPAVSVSGIYTVVATAQGNGCTASATATVTQNTDVPVVSASGTTLTCAVTSGNVMATSIDPTVTYSWSGPNGFMATGANPAVSEPGPYTVTGVSANNGCSSTATATVNQNIVPPLADAGTAANISCATPTVQLNGAGSSQGANYTYAWSTLDGNIVSGAATPTPTVDAPGTYTLMVSNTINACTASDFVLVIQNPPLALQAGSIGNVSCNGGANGMASVLAEGGDGNYSYVWSTGDTSISVSNLAAGTYTVTVHDGASCTGSFTFVITEPAVLLASATATAETALGANDGTAYVLGSGGTLPYNYLWSNGVLGDSIAGLSPGAYTVSLTDANGCLAVQSVTVNSFNCALSASVSTVPVSCFGENNGMATLSVLGAAMPISYLWSNGDTTATVVGLAAGAYTVQITDANNCPALLNLSITQPAALLTNATATAETANGANDGTATASPTGGTGPYSYVWSTGATLAGISGLAPGVYTVTVTDDNGCTKEKTVSVNSFNCQLSAVVSVAPVSCAGGSDGIATVSISGGALPLVYTWSNGGSAATNSGLAAGVYTVVVEDANGCIEMATATVGQPDSLRLESLAVMPVSCPETANGSVVINITGGVQPYSSSQSLNNLGLGAYNIQITDANNCSIQANFIIESGDTIAPQINCPLQDMTICQGSPLQFDLPLVSDNCLLTGAGSMPVLVSGMPSGSVFPLGETVEVFKVSDASGNTATCSFVVEVVASPVATVVNVENDMGNQGVGSIDVQVEGGTGPYSFSWFGPDGMHVSNDEDPSGLHAGSYLLAVLDANGCSAFLGPVNVFNTVSTHSLTDDWSVRLWPNPTRERLYLSVQGEQADCIRIFDGQGSLVDALDANDCVDGIDVHSFDSGFYWMQVITRSGKSAMLRWVKSK